MYALHKCYYSYDIIDGEGGRGGEDELLEKSSLSAFKSVTAGLFIFLKKPRGK